MVPPFNKSTIGIGLESTRGTGVVVGLDDISIREAFRRLETAIIRAKLESKYGPLPKQPEKYNGIPRPETQNHS